MIGLRLASASWVCPRATVISGWVPSVRRCSENITPHIPDPKKSCDLGLLAFALDGRGGACRLDHSDEDCMRRIVISMRSTDPLESKQNLVSGLWIHSDFKSKDTNGWLKRVFGRRVAAQTYDWLVEDLAEARPTCLISPSMDALSLTLRAARGLPKGLMKQGPKLVALRIWLMRDIIITSRESLPGEEVTLVPEFESQLLEGIGPKSCGGLAAAIAGRTMALSILAAQEAEDEVFLMKERLQVLAVGSLAQRRLELLRRELAQVRYNVMLLRRYLFPQHEPFDELLHFCQSPDQNIFNEKAVMLCQRAHERHQTLMERLDAAHNGGEALQGEVLALIGWATAVATYHLTILCSVLSLFGFLHVSFDVINFVERRRLSREMSSTAKV